MGLDRELFEGEVAEEFLCGICHQVLLNPVTAGCFHMFCQACVIRKMKSRVTKPVCPVCSAALSLNMTDTPIEFKLKLLNLSTQCSHNCGDAFVLAELPDHMDVCPNAPVQCHFTAQGCPRKVKRCDLRKHLHECDFREVECEACGFRTLYRELFTHQSRVRCLEKKLKQQIIRERKASSREIIRHREKLVKEHAKFDQQQRKRILSHAKSQASRKSERQTTAGSECGDSEFDFATTQESVFLTEDVINRHNQQRHHSEEAKRMEVSRQLTKTPHSSRSGFASNMCSQCNRKFIPQQNTQAACRWHVGVGTSRELYFRYSYVLIK
ncbi:E3 ubiquitin-protein ligase PDZRN3-like [Dreissena polymorpha]|uniref:E3 ubiquitin-protein ligase PDZRN3-like n=1 Tax=Dreissena polymorpha TaxID=45954 RepID=UPI00226539C0|nr:E3 ubiquitin-protein ligase PDZRN3-like [Dreissena polymorpha]XP_052262421.1 E3 ubiquitin-protein ligase PDZRN3-like [Dreissena polymorpha]XP_052262422.1 E3 ubiquitin-protein ligase PDZRN3-like [Dreissena polymorpha]